MKVQAQSGPWQIRSRPSGAGKHLADHAPGDDRRDQVEVVVFGRDVERKPALGEIGNPAPSRRASQCTRSRASASAGGRATGRERRDDRKQGLAQPFARASARAAAGGIRLRAAGEGAQALSGQQVRVRRPFEQALVAVEPVARRRLVAARHRVDEIERRIAADEIPLAEAVVLDNL